jgi:hypothetical protein
MPVLFQRTVKIIFMATFIIFQRKEYLNAVIQIPLCLCLEISIFLEIKLFMYVMFYYL